jgi:hypothetical protein
MGRTARQRRSTDDYARAVRPPSNLAAIVALALLAAACGEASPSPTGPQGLQAGTYRSQSFQPQVTFTLPDGWWLPADTPDYLGLQPVSSDLIGIHLFRDPLPASQDQSCPIEPEPGVGSAALALVNWARSLPGFVASNPKPVALGELQGIQIDLAIADGWTPSCPFANGLPTVPLFVGQADESFRWVVAGSETLRLWLFDLPGGGTFVVDIDAYDGSLMDDLLSLATPIVASMGVSPD